MVSIPAAELADEIFQECLRYGTWSARTLDTLIERAIDPVDPFLEAAATKALFSVLVEQLADRFEPVLCALYAEIFAHIVARVLPDFRADELKLRYNRVRQNRRYWGGDLKRIYVLSRVTLGADIAVTSVVISGLKRRFPDSEICFVGPTKNAEMFLADPRVVPVPINYSRSGTLRERLAAAAELREAVDEPESIVVDPDSRLTQLGIIPCGDDSRYYFFESRAFGGSSDESLPLLTASWLDEVFGAGPAAAYVAPEPVEKIADICVSWGVGENATKRVSNEFELEILKALVKKGRPILLDRGAGGEEGKRADELQSQLDSPLLTLHTGSYASFASHIAQSRLYAGYDSAGQHVASAAAVPLISIFGGHVCDRMMHRWSPTGPQSKIVLFDGSNHCAVREAALKAIEEAAL